MSMSGANGDRRRGAVGGKAGGGRAKAVDPLAGAPRARRPEARPDEILDAALEEFSALGFDAARMDDIAARAGISKAGVYLYFESKTALLEALIEREVAPVAERVKFLADAGAAAPLETLRMIATLVATRFGDPRIFQTPRLVISVSNRFPEIVAQYRRRVVDVAVAAAETLVTHARAAGLMREEVQPRAVIRAFIGPMLFEAMWAHVLGGESAFAQPERLIEEHLDMVLNGAAKRS